MRGHVRKRGKSWSIVFDTRDEGGHRRRRWISGTQHQGRPWRTRKEAEGALPAILGKVADDAYIEPSALSFGGYLADWLERHRPNIRLTTYDSYRRALSVHVLGHRIAGVPLQRVRASDLTALYGELLDRGRRGGGGLKPRTVRYVHAVVRRALQDAVEDDPPKLMRNVADRARPPEAKATRPPKPTTWSPDQLRTFLEHVRGDRLAAAWLALATTGMRRGELLGLRRSDLDLGGGRLSVVQTLTAVSRPDEDGSRLVFGPVKSERGFRSISLDGETLSGLRSHLKRQAAERLRWGVAYQDRELVFCQEDGSPLDPSELSKAFRRHTRAAGLPPIRLHDLRHGMATAWLAAGVHPKVVQERLGHHSASFTLDTYSHTIPALQEEAAAKVAGLIFGR